MTKKHQNNWRLKMFLYKSQFLLIFFFSIPIELWESTAAIFRQSAGYVISSTGVLSAFCTAFFFPTVLLSDHRTVVLFV